MKLVRIGFATAVVGVGLWSDTVCGGIKGPYATDASTVHLFHLDEEAGAVAATNAVAGKFTAYAVDGNPIGNNSTPLTSVGGILGSAGFAGFGNAANVSAPDLAVAYDGVGDSSFIPDVSASAQSPDRIPLASLVGADGSFTLEAMILLPSGQGLTSNREIIATDNQQTGASRGFQFRLNSSGNLEFTLNSSGAGYSVPVPTSGDHAFANDTWFHVAFTYDGTSSENKFYWTKVDSSFTAANQLGTTSMVLRNVGQREAPLVIGNENRGTMGEGLGGLIDEVRISSVARGPNDFIFDLPGDFDGDGDVDGADFVVWQTNFPAENGHTLGSGDADGDTDVDGADFAAWQSGFPAGSNPATSPVPEPGAGIVALVAAVLALRGACGRKK